MTAPPAPSGDTTGSWDTTNLQNYIDSLPPDSVVTFEDGSVYYINSLKFPVPVSVFGTVTFRVMNPTNGGITLTGAGAFVWDGPILVWPPSTTTHIADTDSAGGAG